MKIYYYHTQDIQRIWREWHEHLFPGHLLYGATHFRQHGIDMILHRFNPTTVHWRLTLYNTWRILTCRERYDVLYGTSFRGIEVIIFLRALGLFRHPVVIWHHQPIVKAKGWLRERIARLFYRGIDQMFFFSEKLVNDSLQSVKARRERMHVAHWGPDLDFYDHVMHEAGEVERLGFISTGKECRDYATLIRAFNRTGAPLELYLNHRNGSIDYDKQLEGIEIGPNINASFLHRLMPGELAQRVNLAACEVICCLPTNYTVGLTTVAEALAMRLPILCTRNPQMPFDLEREGCGLWIENGDEQGWVEAVEYIATHPEEARLMGERGRQLAERSFNLETLTRDVAEVLLTYGITPSRIEKE